MPAANDGRTAEAASGVSAVAAEEVALGVGVKVRVAPAMAAVAAGEVAVGATGVEGRLGGVGAGCGCGRSRTPQTNPNPTINTRNDTNRTQM
jgi:hypothetical protein